MSAFPLPNRPVPPSPNPSAMARADVIGRESVSELQRARILAAMTELVRERGVARITVADVITRSGVSRRTFYECFEDRQSCLLDAFEHAVRRAADAVVPAYEAPGASWDERIRASLDALLRFLDAEPAIGGLCIVDALAGKRPLLERRARVLGVVVDAVQRGSRVRNRGLSSPAPAGRRSRIVAEGAVGAVLAVLHARLCEHDPEPLAGLLNELTSIVVLPYLGPERAALELRRRTPPVRVGAPVPGSSPVSSDPLRGLDMRLTYRTVRVLLAIAEHPAASGRQVADASGISDQGQMSKLLARLQRLGLIHNDAAGHAKGAPNAWTLTDSGRHVERALRAQTAGQAATATTPGVGDSTPARAPRVPKAR
jgi:AcrR family transcriptional regulator/DNA-binding MarR family transcriptional regulator